MRIRATTKAGYRALRRVREQECSAKYAVDEAPANRSVAQAQSGADEASQRQIELAVRFSLMDTIGAGQLLWSELEPLLGQHEGVLVGRTIFSSCVLFFIQLY